MVFDMFKRCNLLMYLTNTYVFKTFGGGQLPDFPSLVAGLSCPHKFPCSYTYAAIYWQTETSGWDNIHNFCLG